MLTKWIRINRIDVKSPPHYDLTENALRTNFPINDHLNPLVFHPRSNDENCLAKWRFVPVSAWVDSFRMQFSGFKTTPSTPGGRQATTTQNHARCLYSTTAARGRETISSTQYVRQNYVDCKTARNVDGSGDAGCKCTAFTLARSWAESGLSPSHCDDSTVQRSECTANGWRTKMWTKYFCLCVYVSLVGKIASASGVECQLS